MIEVLRLGHRRARDPRLTTHICLTARALGARAVHVTSEDAELVKTVTDVTERFGGPFEIHTGVAWKRLVTDWKAKGGVVVHLTMYGEPFGPALDELKGRDVLVVVGAEKVPGDLYRLADRNVAVGNQPHSEVAALAITLDRLSEGAWTSKSFVGRLRVVPNPRGKTIIEDESSR
jgi:tRNA (cytidine56-2'-O)-methyltransferase